MGFVFVTLADEVVWPTLQKSTFAPISTVRKDGIPRGQACGI